MLGLRRDAHTVALAECETTGFDLQIHTFSGIEKGNFFTHMSLGMQIGAGTGRDHHHAEFNGASGIGGQQLVDDIGFILSADGLAGSGSNNGLILAFLFKKIIERGIKCPGKCPQGVDGWIHLTILDLAEHGSGDAGGRREFADGGFLL